MRHPRNDDKELLLYALLKLQLVTGKIIFFVNDVNRCYELKLLLEQFAIKSAVLNAELPANSRAHIMQQFNRGMFDHLIATDESLEAGSDDDDDSSSSSSSEEEEEEEEEDDDDDNDNDADELGSLR